MTKSAKQVSPATPTQQPERETFDGVFSAHRLSQGIDDLRKNGPTFSHFAFLNDIFMVVLALLVATVLSIGADHAGELVSIAKFDVPVVIVLAGVAFLIFRPYRSLWRYTSLSDLLSILRVTTLVCLMYVAVDQSVGISGHATWALYADFWLFMIGFLSGPRVAARVAKTPKSQSTISAGYERIPLLLVGAGDGTELFLRALSRDASMKFRVVGIVDEMGANFRRSIHGIEVLGALGDLDQVVRSLAERGERPRRLVVTEDQLSPATLQSLLDDSEKLGLTLSRIPRVTELKGDLNREVEIKPVAIEDLLGRSQTLLDRGSMRDLCNSAGIIVTGAGGTIGSELVRQICSYSPRHIVLIDNSEFNLYQIDMEVGERFPDVERSVVMADVRDRQRILELFEQYSPELVFHAAAMKHVPMVEMHPSEGVLTNVHGTKNVADAAMGAGAKAMVLISTDKAVNPTSVMGATKRIAECYCQALDAEGATKGSTRFLTVRFGNVLGSTGSVVPLFQKQLAQGGPLTVTHPAVTRYFMTTREAVALVLQASALGCRTSEHRGSIYTLEMGSAVRIQDLARQMIRLAGLRPGEDIDIVYTGLRPGEKLYEEPLHQSEELVLTEVEGILLAFPRTADLTMLQRLVNELVEVSELADVARARSLIRTIVPEYTPTANKDGALTNSFIPVQHRASVNRHAG